MIKKIYILLLISLFYFKLNAQYTTTGSATVESCNCFQLTPNTTNQTGSFYNNTTINLSAAFNLKFTVNFGCSDAGGEGLAFVMQSTPWTVGTGGLGIGYQGIANSVAIEFDTRDNQASGQNTWGDIPGDHIAIQGNGVVNHFTTTPVGSGNLVGVGLAPVLIKPGVANLEDCENHTVEIIWNPVGFMMEILVDGLSSFGGPVSVGNIVANNFGGNPNVLWGWTAATSPFTNKQKVCLAIEPEMTYTATNCPGQPIDFFGSAFTNNTIVSYDWNFDGIGTSNLQNPTFTFPTSGNKTITLEITDNNGCSSIKTFNIGVGFVVNITADQNPICENSSTVLTASASPYVPEQCCFELRLRDAWGDGWTGDNVTVFVNGSATGTYTCPIATPGTPYIEVIELCFNQNDVVQIVVNIGSNSFPFECSYQLIDVGGVAVLQVNSGASWYNGNTQSFTVDCGLTPPSYVYQWDNITGYLSADNIPNPTATIPSTTTFNMTVTDPITGCTIPQSIVLNTFAPVTADISGNITVCQGNTGGLTLTFTGPGPYNFTVQDPLGGTISQTGVSTPYTLNVGINGNYTLISASGNGCNASSLTGTGTLNVIIPPTVDISTTPLSYCDGVAINPITVVSGSGGTVNWYTNPGLTGAPIHTGNSYTPTQGVGSVTYYAQEVEGVLGCGGPADNVTIVVHPIPPAPIYTGQTVYCQGELPSPLTAETTYSGTISWYDNVSLTPPVLSTLISYNPTLVVGTLNLYITETANGCQGPYTHITVLTKPTPGAPDITGTLVYCEGETPSPLVATPTVGGNIQWFNASGTSIGTGVNYTPNLALGNQTFSASESLNGCTGPLQSVSLTVNVFPTVSVPELKKICYGDSIQITAVNNGFDITWSDGQTGASVWFKPEVTTIYTVTATNPLCGFTDDEIEIKVFNLPLVKAGNDTIIGIGGESNLWVTGALTYQWAPEPDNCLNDNCSKVYVVPNQATVYVVRGKDINGCFNYDTVLVDISGYMDVFVPNVFSPNGDGWNDFLEVQGPRLYDYKIEIFDRWGKLIFESNDQKDSWDGTYNGEYLAPQTVVYMIKGETLLGEKIKRTGNVTIIK